ncbi:hypothetical protein [Kutzneria buriramensis]|uniref:Uncharacterized protein n=1 Tax=Kutzneria buriramensis TaxID=1045776 RepID=A0A3E0I9W0_9PSEU|nr:hypothetical protein [Kutzneria buriramensis]REH55447.1 hypothetical protein BCF44_101468 [Kutzneria buriramensis]
MHVNDFPGIDDITEPTADDIAAIDASGTLTTLDAEYHYLISHPKLSSEFAQLREPRPEPTTSLLDGSARARRDRRIAQRTLGNAVRVLSVHSDLTTTTTTQAGNEAA